MKRAMFRDGRQVVLQSDLLSINCDTAFGGTPLHWYQLQPSGAKILVTDPFPGAGAAINWETGQDPTQSSANGPDPFPISTFEDQASWPRSYYAHETHFNWADYMYEVDGFAPMFWASVEAHDDSIATDPRDGSGVWSTAYHDRLGFGRDHYSQFGVPIYFYPSRERSSGYIFIGNEMEKTGHWADRRCVIPKGRFAFYLNISLSHASGDAIAGVTMRRNHGERDVHDVYSGNGYDLYVNESGTLQFLRNNQVVWQSLNNQLVARKVNGPTGVKLEIRTNTMIPGYFEIYAENLKLGSYFDESPIKVETMALFGQCQSGIIKYSDRHFFDLNKRFRSTYRITEAGAFRTELSVLPTPGLINPSQQLYRANLPGVFVANHVASCVKIFNRKGEQLPPTDDEIYPILAEGDSVPAAFWVGNENGTLGVFCVPRSCADTVVGQPHALVFNSAISAIMLNPLPRATEEQTKWYISSVQIVADWLTHIDLDLLNEE